jgi:hypothetical protein
LDEQTNDLRKKGYLLNIMDFMAKIVKNSLSEQEYKQIGRLPKFFNPKDKVDIPQY